MSVLVESELFSPTPCKKKKNFPLQLSLINYVSHLKKTTTFYLVIFDSLGDFHADREQLIEATDKRISYRVENKFMA